MSIVSLDKSLGFQPESYARLLLKECGIICPPVDEKTVLNHLDLEVFPLTRAIIDDYVEDCGSLMNTPDFIENLKDTCAWLKKEPSGKSTVFVLEDQYERRKRMSIFHECGHYILPWHDYFYYHCAEKDINSPNSIIEKEAFQCGVELMMPKEFFFNDAMSQEAGIATIKSLSDRYNSSLEATAIRYCSLRIRDCAMMIVEPSGNIPAVEEREPCQSDDNLLFAPSDSHLSPRIPGNQYPLKVKYFVTSSKSMGYAEKGTSICDSNPIFDTWNSGRPFQGQIHASIWGSSKDIRFNAECMRLGNTGKVLVLLWLPDNILWLRF